MAGLCVTVIHAQQRDPLPGDEILARVGPRTITVQDFQERIDFMPWPGKDNPATRDSAKIQALASLVAEKLLSIQAADQGFLENSKTSTAINAIEKLLSRDLLYRREVMGRITISEEELQTALRRYASIVRLNTYRMDTEENARRLAEELNRHTDDPLFSPTATGILAHDTIAVSFGDLTVSYEEVAFRLDSVRRAEVAFDADVGWSVFQLVEKYSNPAFVRATMQERLAAATQKLKKRKERRQEVEFNRGFFTHSMIMDSAAFRQVAESLFVIMLKDSAGHRQEGFFGIRGDDVDELRRALLPILHTPFATMGNLSVTTGEMIEELKFFPLKFEALRKGAFLYTLNKSIQPVAEAAVLSQEAIRRRLNATQEVQRELGMWGDAVQAEKLLKYLLDSLARAEARSADYAQPADERRVVNTINNYLISLARKYNVEMYFGKLVNVPVSTSNMVTRRRIGFGGSMMAVPMIMRLFEWLERWNSTTIISP